MKTKEITQKSLFLSFLPPFLTGLLAITGLMLLDTLTLNVEFFQNSGLARLPFISQVLLLSLPAIFVVVAPVVFIWVVTMMTRKIVRHNRHIPLPKLKFIRLFLLLAILLSLAGYYVNETIVPAANRQYLDMYYDAMNNFHKQYDDNNREALLETYNIPVKTFSYQQVVRPLWTMKEMNAFEAKVTLKERKSYGMDIHRDTIDYYFKYSLPAAPIFMMFLAIAFGIELAKSNTIASGIAALAPVFGWYWLYNKVISLGYAGSLTPAVTAWSPNLVIGVIGLIWLLVYDLRFKPRTPLPSF